MEEREVRFLSQELKLTHEVKRIFETISLDPERDTDKIKSIYGIPQTPGNATTNPARGSTSCNIQLDFKNKQFYENTILHSITLAFKDHHQDFAIFMKLFDAVISSAYIWWCCHHLDPTTSNIEGKRRAVRHLATVIKNAKGLSVLELAFKTGATPVVERLLTLEGVWYCSRTQSYDITDITPLTAGSVTKHMGCECLPEPSCLERLLCNSPGGARGILDLPPMMAIESMYNSVTQKIYIVFTLLHILYMTLFSYASCDIVEKRRNSTAGTMDGTRLLFFTVGPIEPALFTIYSLYNLYKVISCKAMFWVNFDRGHSVVRGMGSCRKAIVSSLYITLFVCFATVFMVLCTVNNSDSLYYMMSLTLMYGWLLTFRFAKGVKNIHFYLRVILHLIIYDVMKILLVYIFFLLAFALALHSQFLVSFRLSNIYKTPIHTMFLLFNVMFGMGELFDAEMDSNLEQGGVAPLFSKVLYILYVGLTTLILLNVLIAIMNKSYARIEKDHPLSWRVEAIQLGINVERTIPWLSRCLGTGGIREGPLFEGMGSREFWYIETADDQEKGNAAFRVKEKSLKDIEDNLIEKLDNIRKKHDEQMNDLKRILEEVTRQLQQFTDNIQHTQSGRNVNVTRGGNVMESGEAVRNSSSDITEEANHTETVTTVSSVSRRQAWTSNRDENSHTKTWTGYYSTQA